MCKLYAVTLPRDDRIEYGEPTEACDVAQYMVDLYIHLAKRFLDVKYVFGRHLQETLPMPPQRTNGANLIRRPETALQKANGMQVPDPLTVRNIALSPRYAF